MDKNTKLNQKINAMQQEYGITENKKCGDCCNFKSYKYAKTYSKCIAYGETHCPTTDWSRYHGACGLHGKDFKSMGLKPLMQALKRAPKKADDEILVGQMNLNYFFHEKEGAH